MKRRDFLRSTSLLLPVVWGGLSAGLPEKLFGQPTENNMFSLSIVTDKPSETIHNVENIFRFSKYSNFNINFSEYKLVGKHVADFALIENGNLVNYLKNGSEFSKYLRKTAQNLSFPKNVTDPALLIFSAGNSGKPQYFDVSVSNKLVKRIPVNTKNGIYKINGIKGKLELEINGKSAKVFSSSCRHKTCLEMGEIKNPGENLVCIPEQISISVSGTRKGNIDSVTF